VTGVVRPVTAADGRLDVAATLAPVPAMVEAGVTDVGVQLRLPAGGEAAEEVLRPLVEAFRLVVGREPAAS
jgi:hypothetical protein